MVVRRRYRESALELCIIKMCGYGICETNTSPSNTDDLLEWSVRSGGGGGGTSNSATLQYIGR